jgi:hypothetical protein
MCKRISCFTAVSSFDLLHAFMLPTCILSILLPPFPPTCHPTFLPVCDSLCPVYPACPSLSLPSACQFAMHLYFHTFQHDYNATLLAFLPAGVPAGICQATYICIQFCIPFCLLISLPDFLPNHLCQHAPSADHLCA